MNILMIVGSLRKGSFNHILAEAAARFLVPDANVTFLDWRSLPILDAHDTYPFDAPDEAVRKEIGSADALFIVSPEYNASYPGGLKNLLDIASLTWVKGDYASGSPLMGKPVAIAGVGGKSGTAHMQKELAKLLTNLRCKVMEDPMAKIVLPPEAFKTGEWTPSAPDMEAIKKECTAFLTFIRQQ